MDWIQVITFAGINITLFGAMSTLVIWAINRMEASITRVENRLDGHAQRIDQVYGVILSMLKEKN